MTANYLRFLTILVSGSYAPAYTVGHNSRIRVSSILVLVQVLREFAVGRFFFLQVKKAKDFFVPTSYIQGHVRGSRWVRQGRQEGGSREGKVPCALHQEFLFLVHEYLGSGRHVSFEVLAPTRLKSTRKPCAKEVPETDYFTQQKQYLKRTTLCRLKILLRSICSKEEPHYRLGAKREQQSCHMTSDNQPFFSRVGYPWWFPTWAVLRSLANARKCQLEDFCEEPHYWVSSGGIFQNGIIRLVCNLENTEYSKME